MCSALVELIKIRIAFQITKLREEIESEIEALRMERRQLEFHIERTEVWAENIGRWKAHIYNSEVG